MTKSGTSGVAVTCILSCWGWWSAACRPCCMWPARRYRWPPSCSPGWCGPSLWSNHCPRSLHPRNVKKLLRTTINLNTSIFIGVIGSKGVGTGSRFKQMSQEGQYYSQMDRSQFRDCDNQIVSHPQVSFWWLIVFLHYFDIVRTNFGSLRICLWSAVVTADICLSTKGYWRVHRDSLSRWLTGHHTCEPSDIGWICCDPGEQKELVSS